MWNATKHEISELDVGHEHLRVLEEAVKEAQEFGFRRDDHKALNYFAARCDRQGGINLFLAGLRDGRPDYMRDGLKLLKKHLGGG